MTTKLFAAPLTLLFLLLAACGGDDKPDARALLTESFKKVGEQKTVSGTLKTTIASNAIDLEILQQVYVEPSEQKGYVKSTSDLFDEFDNEIVLDGSRAWVRRGDRGAWLETTSERLGIKPESLSTTTDTTKAAKTIELQPDVTREGRPAYHVRAIIDPRSKDLADIAPSLAGMQDLDSDEIVIDYFIAKQDKLLYGVKIYLEAREDGETFELTMEATYHDYNKAISYPTDVPR